MLTTEDFHHNLQIISMGCKLGIFPLRFNPKSKQLELLTSKWKRVTCYIYFALYTVHTTYITKRLPYLLFVGAELSLLSLVVHFSLICGVLAGLFWHFTAFFRYPGITATCYNKALESWGFVREGGIFAIESFFLVEDVHTDCLEK